ncbi:MAG: hypothetical protein M3529_10200 [Actinomycetota bacterium]|nr:hypothetical protein [Actinomycetota bacterium]
MSTRSVAARTFTAGATALAVLAVLVVGGVLVLRELVDPFSSEPVCTAGVEGTSAVLDLEQARYAATIAAVSVQRGLPARAASIALATAFQESKIVNIDYGDRDSLGLFQQRPSQGWGSPSQIMDPYYATNRFYSALEQVDGYRSLPIDEAAQMVQRSADGRAYAPHEERARTLASALTGFSPAAFSCEVEPPSPSAKGPDAQGLTPRAQAVRREVESAFGDVPQGGFAPDGVQSGHQQGSAHYDGRAVDFFFRPVNDANNRRGWALAHFLVAQAERMAISTVIFDDRIWTAARSDQGWREYDEGSGSGDPDIRRHLDHVHVDVA